MSATETKVDYPHLAKEARKKILTMIHLAGTSHIASNFSCIDFATVLYENLKEGDEVVWSAGWKAASIYYFLAKQGKIPKEDLDRFAKEENGKIEYLGLAETNVPGVWVNGGSVGHGLPVAVGMALAKKRAGEPGTIYCIMSDGELNEGTTWEAALLAAQHHLDNLVVLVDQNGWQAMGRTEDILPSVFPTWATNSTVPGWNWRGIPGHDYELIEEVLMQTEFVRSVVSQIPRPTVIIFYTIKGKGVSFMENHLLYHYKHVEKSEYEKAMAELG